MNMRQLLHLRRPRVALILAMLPVTTGLVLADVPRDATHQHGTAVAKPS